MILRSESLFIPASSFMARPARNASLARVVPGDRVKNNFTNNMSINTAAPANNTQASVLEEPFVCFDGISMFLYLYKLVNGEWSMVNSSRSLRLINILHCQKSFADCRLPFHVCL